MHKFLNIIIIMCLTGFISCDPAESPGPQNGQVFLKLYGGVKRDEGSDLLQTEDGGFVIAGRTTSYSEDDFDVLLVKTDNNGNRVWSRRIGDDSDNKANSIIYTNDKNGFVICGETTNGNGRRDIYVVKTDMEGNELASAQYGQPGLDETGENVISAPSGGYFIVGNNYLAESSPAQADSTYFYFLEVDENLQAKPGRNRSDYGRQGYFNESKAAVAVDDNKYLIFGTTTDGNGLNINTKNLYVFEIDFAGVGISKGFSFGDNSDEYGTDMAKVTSGYVLAGYQIKNNRSFPYIIKVKNNLFNQANPVIWEKTYENFDVLTGSNEPTSVIESNDGGYAVLMTSDISQYGSQIGLMKIDALGNKLWERHIGSQNNDTSGKIIQLEDNCYVACGSFSIGENPSQDIRKMGLIKTNPNGELKPMGD